ncbi:cytochrome c oxidase subunit II, partial [Candidatus Poribacteria bacterium]|nr:cytochrome c oxidase subunit II [Candidatus Poribacteria bacterium]
PIHHPVHVYLRSKDVIHSFFVPTLRVKQDALPGREIALWFEADVAGQYEIACAELCGPNHYTMRGFLNVHTADEYAAWVGETWGDN